ncbi:hypothetical protein [Salegentibacter chungangensis]|uniref:ATP synthase subunit I n=1 Tax=Salegentibacter chungangensis TaxID=1335724 RepID=A0ABW3NLN0_9FLAO
MKKDLVPFLKKFLPYSIILFFTQWLLVNYFFEEELYYNTISVYAFHIISTLLIYIALVWVHKNFKDKTGFAFMGGGLLKMMAAVVFLLPMLLSEAPGFNDIIAFFIPYFLFLIFETFYAVKLINAQ